MGFKIRYGATGLCKPDLDLCEKLPADFGCQRSTWYICKFNDDDDDDEMTLKLTLTMTLTFDI